MPRLGRGARPGPLVPGLVLGLILLGGTRPAPAGESWDAVYIGRSKEGRFRLDEKHGPVAGRYRVQVRVLSTEASDMKVGKTSLPDELTYEHAEGTDAPLALDIKPGLTPLSLRFSR